MSSKRPRAKCGTRSWWCWRKVRSLKVSEGGIFALIQQGTFNERRYNLPVDCSNIIWIIASKLGTEEINDAYNKNVRELDDEAHDQADLGFLQKNLREIFSSKFGVGVISYLKNVKVLIV